MNDEERQTDEDVTAEVLAAGDLPGHYFDLYELAVEMADRTSARRGVANSFFLTVNTGVVALLSSGEVRWPLAVAGILVTVVWWSLLKSYRDLNSAKFAIILGMEEKLPARVYGEEWDRLRRATVPFSFRRREMRSWLAQYRELGRIERFVPWIFALIYVAIMVQGS